MSTKIKPNHAPISSIEAGRIKPLLLSYRLSLKKKVTAEKVMFKTTYYLLLLCQLYSVWMNLEKHVIIAKATCR